MERSTRKTLSALAGVFLITGSCMGIVHGIRAGAAQILYRETKPSSFEPVVLTPEIAAENCVWADRLYPHNYYFSIWVAEQAYYQRMDPLSGREIPERVALAERWCDRGLRQNYHDRQLRALKARLLARKSPAEAAEYWESYVDWDFWEPHNHAMLVEMNALAGDYEKALAAFQWVKGTRHEADARKRLQEILAAEKHPPRAVPAPVPRQSPD